MSPRPKMPKVKSSFITFALEPELKDLIRTAARDNGLQMSDFVRLSVINYLRNLGYKVEIVE